MHQEIPGWQFDDEFDGGEETCGRVIINLHLYLRTQPSGYRFWSFPGSRGAHGTAGLVPHDPQHARGAKASLLSYHP